MKILLLLCVIVAVSTKETKKQETKCDGVHVRGKFYRKEVLARGLNRPYQLSIYKKAHKIYFSQNVGEDDADTFKIGYVEKNQTGHKEIKEIENGFATVVDEHHHVVYFGGSKGIYEHKLNEKGSNITKIINNYNIWDMFFKEELYFINYPAQHLYKYNTHKSKSKPERQKHIHEKIYQFIIDSDRDVFITNDTGLYRIKNGTDHRIHYKGPTIFRALELNNKGEAHFCGKHAIYVPNKSNNTLEEIAHIKNVFGLVFDSEDNIIFSDPHEIVKLLPGDCK